jgi:hypothetical protein
MTSERQPRTVYEQNRLARARAAEKIRQTAESGRVVRIVAEHAVDAQDYIRLLSMLGLEPADWRIDDTVRPQA